MKKFILLLVGFLSVFTVLGQQSELFMDGFTPSGAFQLQVNAGPLQIDYSTNFVSWMPLTNGNDKVVDLASTGSEWRFYRGHKANNFTSNVVGFVRVPVPPGKMAAVASPFSAPIHLDQPRVRKAVLGSETPAVQIAINQNGKETTYTFDELSNAWTPAVPPIPWGTGFIVRNTGKTPIHVTFAGQVPLGALKHPIPQGQALIGAMVPKPAPLHDAVGAPPVEGAQLEIWDEQKQAFQTSSFNKQTGRWDPPLHYKPGRAVVAKYPKPAVQAAFAAGHPNASTNVVK